MVVVESRSDCTHNGVSLVVEGIVNLQLSAKSVGVFEAFYNSAKVFLQGFRLWNASNVCIINEIETYACANYYIK